MNLDRLHPRAVLAATLLAIAAFCVAEQDPAIAILGLAGLPVAWWLRTRSQRWLGADASVAGVHGPLGQGGMVWLRWNHQTQVRLLMNTIAVVALAYTLLVGLREGIRVEHVATLIVVLAVLKGYDRFNSRDYGQLLALSVFLGIAAVLTSVRLEVGLVMLIFVPTLAAAVMLHQIQSAREWASRATRGRRMSVRPFVAGRGMMVHFRWLLIFTILATASGATAIFVMIPRGIGAGIFGDWGSAPSGSQTRFTPEVELGRGGFISTSPTVVMHVEISDGEHRLGGTNRVYYLRGNILDTYDSTRRRWTRGSDERPAPSARSSVRAGQPILMGQQTRQALVQRVTILNASHDEQYIFSVLRPTSVVIERDIGVRHDPVTSRLAVTGARGELRYTVLSSEVDRPRGPPTPASFDSRLIRELAERIVRDANVDLEAIAEDPSAGAAAARALESYLRANYTYTLDILAAPGNVDPIEWFLFESRVGHCEYFASGLAALCRSIGINARVVAGYVAAEWNEGSRHYVVREANAHAWVEVEHGRDSWRTYDATPPGDLERQHRPAGGLVHWFRRAFDAMSYAWNSSVISFDPGTRERLSRADRGGRGDWFTKTVEIYERLRFGGGELALRAVLVAVAVFAAAAAFGFFVRWLAPWLVRLGAIRPRLRSRAGGDTSAWAVPADFYERMLRLLETRGLDKPAWLPPLAHADTIAHNDATLAHALARIADLFYQARFGARTLTPEELAEADRMLQQAGTHVSSAMGNKPPS